MKRPTEWCSESLEILFPVDFSDRRSIHAPHALARDSHSAARYRPGGVLYDALLFAVAGREVLRGLARAAATAAVSRDTPRLNCLSASSTPRPMFHKTPICFSIPIKS